MAAGITQQQTIGKKTLHVVTQKIDNLVNKVVVQEIFRQNAESIRVLPDVCNKMLQERHELKKELYFATRI